MHNTIDEQQNIISQVTNKVTDLYSLPHNQIIADFIAEILSSVAADDLSQYSTDELYSKMISFWSFINTKTKNHLNIRVYNPTFHDHGWESKNTIIEINCNDYPFLLNSIMIAVNSTGIHSKLIMHAEAIGFVRNDNNEIIDRQQESSTLVKEAAILIEINKQHDQIIIQNLTEKIIAAIEKVTLIVKDWPQMISAVKDSINNLTNTQSYYNDNNQESIEFLQWMLADNFLFFGIKDYFFNEENCTSVSIGMLNNKIIHSNSSLNNKLSAKSIKLIKNSKYSLIIAKTDLLSEIQRSAFVDYVGVKIFDISGKIIGQRKIIGLFTDQAYHTPPSSIPLVRNKVSKLYNINHGGNMTYTNKVIRNIINTLPQDELFHSSSLQLYKLAKGISYLQERKMIRFFSRQDHYSNFISCFIFVPRERFNTKLREKYQQILSDEFLADTIQFSTYFSDSVLTRIHFIIHSNKYKKEINNKYIEKKLIEGSKLWHDNFLSCLVNHYGDIDGNKLFQKYENAFSISYQDKYPALAAVNDIETAELVSATHPLHLVSYKPVGDSAQTINLKIFNFMQNIPLSDVVPVIENMGLTVIYEEPYSIQKDKNTIVYVSDYKLTYDKVDNLDLISIKDNIQTCFTKVWENACESDCFNELILLSGLNWREISVLRAYAKYLQQIRCVYTQGFIEQVLVMHPKITKNMLLMFAAKFDPIYSTRNQDLTTIYQQTRDLINQVTSLDEEKILLLYMELLSATIRTNYYKNIGMNNETHLSFKFDSQKITIMPLPKPKYEIFVYSPSFEGIHLRNTKVSRGGIRWSDRKEDYRTEVLGLMKAQVVKNAVIVPSGSKGGFIVRKKLHAYSRKDKIAIGMECYKGFISALLDVTDNYVKHQVVTPKLVVAYDDADPYLVVAADKDTSNFSDVANEISFNNKFWLGDAFASGGSHGYDHKKMGITARGVWESVKRHFYSRGIDIEHNQFTVVGIGDMSGDVFGNGMLLSNKIRLIAAFNHVHIFIDPNPDAVISFTERTRLFNTPGTSWGDYNNKLISKGGGVYNRSDKTIKISSEAQLALGIEANELSSNALIKAIITAPVDLLWNGGIGTHVKASNEKNIQVGDKSNDNTRVNARELKCKIVAEGGNLGFTQLARIEYSLNNGLIYTDFIDNSAGVDCSDHEINIKILLDAVVKNGDLTVKQRNNLLAEMSDEVASLVLQHNYQQTQAINMIYFYAKDNLRLHEKYLDFLESTNQINREVEYLPTSEELQATKQDGRGLSMPCIAVLFAYTKNILTDLILTTNLPEDPFCKEILKSFFPKKIREKYEKYILKHSLKREIIATKISNHLVNSVGFAFVYRMQSETKVSTRLIIKAYLVVNAIFGFDDIRDKIATLESTNQKLQNDLLNQLIRITRRTTRWIVKNQLEEYTINTIVNKYKDTVNQVITLYPKNLQSYNKKYYNKKISLYSEQQLPSNITDFFALSKQLYTTFDSADAILKHEISIDNWLHAYEYLGTEIGISWLKNQIISATVESNWDSLSREALRDDLDMQHKLLTISICMQEINAPVTTNITTWLEKNQNKIKLWQAKINEIKELDTYEFNILFIATRELQDLIINNN